MEILFLKPLDAKHFLMNSSKFLNYYNNLDSNTILFKTGYIEKNINNYLNFKEFNNRDIKKINSIINKLLPNPLVYGKWEFIKLDNSIEQSWPFTIENKILVCDNLLSRDFNSLLYTFAHERIHILQYNYSNIFHTFIINLGFKLKKIYGDYGTIVNYLNPDGIQLPNSSYIYKFKNKYYLPLMVFENNNIKKYSYSIIKKNNKYIINPNLKYDIKEQLSLLFPDTDVHQCYHPNEILADLGGNYILNKHIKDERFIYFFKELSEYIFKYTI